MVNRTKIKGGCQSERKAAEMMSYSKMPLVVPNLVFITRKLEYKTKNAILSTVIQVTMYLGNVCK